MAPRWRSSGVATAEDIVSGLAPGRLAETLMVGMSMFGIGATGSSDKAPMPDSANPMASRVVAIGRRTKAEIMARSYPFVCGAGVAGTPRRRFRQAWKSSPSRLK